MKKQVARPAESFAIEVGRVFLSVARCVLFGDGGRPRYGQTPPIGGVPREDVLKAAAMVKEIIIL